MQPEKVPYMTFSPPPITGKTDHEGIFFDFNKGARVVVPEGDYRVKFIDLDASLTVYDMKASGVIVTSTKVYFVRFRIEVYKGNDLIFSHDYDAAGKNVLLKFAGAALGDVLAWFPYAEEFRKKHQCNLFVAIDEQYHEILRDGYPEITLLKLEEQPSDLYASYYVGLFAPWDDRDLQPVDWRVVGLQAHAAYLLGIEPKEIRPRLTAKNPSPIKEKYVCIATQATAQMKYWNNAAGWIETIAYLKEKGYRVLCIDKDAMTVNGLHGNNIPYGCEDFTGSLPLQQRVDLLAGADFFIGLPSGLSWLAWGVGIPVVMIAGFTLPGTEFSTPYRVQQFHSCHGCGNDARNEHTYDDFGACPHHRGTDREFECTRFITADYVKRVIDRVIEEN